MDSENRRVPMEARESQPNSPELNVYFYRHGEALGQGSDVDITEKGVTQARQAMDGLYNQINIEGSLVKFVSSPIKRCVQTAEAMEQRLRELIDTNKNQSIKIMAQRKRAKVGLPGIAPTLRKLGVEDPMEYWLTHPDVVEGKTPADISKRIEDMLKVFHKVADRVDPGTKINYVFVTHEPYHAAFINQKMGKRLSEVGGDIKNLESMKIHIKGKSEEPVKFEFRDLKVDL